MREIIFTKESSCPTGYQPATLEEVKKFSLAGMIGGNKNFIPTLIATTSLGREGKFFTRDTRKIFSFLRIKLQSPTSETRFMWKKNKKDA